MMTKIMNGKTEKLFEIMKRIYVIMALVLLVAGCAGLAETQEVNQPGQTTEKVLKDFTTSLPDLSSKTVLGSQQGHRSVTWAKGDMVAITYGEAPENSVQAEVLDGGNINAEVGESETYGAVYPVLPVSVSGRELNVTVPSEQDGTFASANVMAALATDADRHFRFVNAAGLFTFEVSDDEYTKVVIRSNDGSPVAGVQTLTFDESGDISRVVYQEEISPEVTVALRGKGTYYVALLKDADLSVGFGMQFYKGDVPQPGILSTTPVVMDASKLTDLGMPDKRIHTGDWYIKPGASGNGTSWENAGGAELLRSLLNANVSEDVEMDGVTLGWRLDRKTIRVAGGEYDLNPTGLPLVLKGNEGLKLSIVGGYPEDANSAQNPEPSPQTNKTVFKATSDRILGIFVPGIEMKISGISFSGGSAAETGGAVNCDIAEGRLDFENCEFISCTAVRSGGAVNILNGKVSFVGCSFESCVAGTGATGWEGENYYQNAGGAVMIYGDASEGRFHRCSFRNNRAYTSADIHLHGTGKLYIDRCSFYMSEVLQESQNTLAHGCSITADSVGDGLSAYPYICINNSTFYDCFSKYKAKGTNNSLPTVTFINGNALICNTTIYGTSISLIRAWDHEAKNIEPNNFHVLNTMFANIRETGQVGVNVQATDINAYCNVMGQAGGDWPQEGSGEDNTLPYSAFDWSDWDGENGLVTWSYAQGTMLEKKADPSVVTTKVLTFFPDFNAWLTEELDLTKPFEVDQQGTPRKNPTSPGAWENPQL